MWSEVETSLVFAETSGHRLSERRRREDPRILCVADDAYAMPLAVTLSSAARQLRPGAELQVYLVDAGIRETNWMGLKETLVDCPIRLHRLTFDATRLNHLPISHHISHAAYVRLLAADLLPTDVGRVLYLDSDLLIRADLTALWETPLEGAWCLAVPDIACPYVDTRRANCNLRDAAPYLATLTPIRNWQQLGLNPGDHYFNSGVMVIDLDAWRREGLASRFLACLAANERSIWCWDQYALNAVMAGHWRRLPLRWNVGSHAYEYPSPRAAPLPREEFAEALADPAIVHFTSEFKPWRFGTRHPQATAFYQALQQTAWRDWRPTQPKWSARAACDRWGMQVQRGATIAWRSLGSRWRGAAQTTAAVSCVPVAQIASPSRGHASGSRAASSWPTSSASVTQASREANP